MAHRVKLPNGTVGVFPDDMPDAEIESVIQKQFPPTQAANDSSIPETPFNGRPPEPEEETGFTGVAIDAADMLGNALSGITKFGEEAPENFRRIKEDVSEHGIKGVGHVLGQLHAGNAELMKSIFNSPYKLSKYLIRKKLLGASEVPIPFTGNNLSDLIPHIPEDTGVEKALGLEAQPERGDNLTRAVPAMVALAEGGYQGVAGFNRWLKSPSKAAALTKPFEENIAKAKEAHAGAEEAHAGAQEAHEAAQAETAAQHNALEKQFSSEHGKPIGTLTPTGQEVKINVKKAKQGEKADAMAIPEKKIGEIPPKPSTEHLEKEIEHKVAASAKAREDLDESLGVLKHPTHKAGRIIKKEIEGVKANSNQLYKDARNHYKEHNILADNDAEIQSVTKDLNKLKDEDELAPGYGHGSEEQKSLGATLEALKTEEVPASDVSALQEHAEKMAQNYREKAFSGVSQYEHEHYLKMANRMQGHADKLAKRLEPVGGKEVQKIFKEARQSWKTYRQALDSSVGKQAYKKGVIPPKSIIDIANTEEGHAFIKALVENDPSLRRHMLAAHIGETSVNKLLRPTEELKKHLDKLPDLQDKIQDLKEAMAEVKTTEKATTAEKTKIKDAYRDLVDSMKAEAKLQSERQKAHAEHAQLDREIKSHEAAIPKLEARIKAEEKTMGEVKSTKAEVTKAKASIAKAKDELAMHKKALAEKHPRKKALAKLVGAGLRLVGLSHIGHKVGL